MINYRKTDKKKKNDKNEPNFRYEKDALSDQENKTGTYKKNNVYLNAKTTSSIEANEKI